MSLFYTRPDRYMHLGVFPEAGVAEVAIHDAPKFMHGLRLLFVSDVHLRPGVKDVQLAALMEQIAAQKADLILLGGDYAETPEQCLRFFEAFKDVSSPMGCYAVAGNNDFDSLSTLPATMEKAGVTLLDNACRSITLSGGRLEIGGCADHKYGQPRTRDLFSGRADAYRILISHFPVQPDCRCDLMLSGHTHGGQCNVLGITPYSIGFEHRFHLLGIRGLVRRGGMRLLIGNGIGVSRFPLRLGAAPQIYLLNFSDAATC